MTFSEVIKKFPKAFWVSNIMEIFERWAWYGFYMALALYLTMSKETGALGFTQVQKGAIIGTGSMLLYLLPIITGAIADRIGFKKVLVLSFTMYIGGFLMMASFESYAMVFFAFIFLAVAGALFKPIISGMIAKTTDKDTASIGFGIFYMMINIGGFIGPFIAGFLYKINWDYVFVMSIIAISINYIVVFFFFKEPDRKPSGMSFLRNIGIALRNIGITLSDWKYVMFLLIMSIFWTAFNQLYYSFPVFIEHWVDLDKLSAAFGSSPGTITTVTLTSMASFFIIAFQLIISTISMRFKPLHAMMVGFIILSGGLLLMFITQNPWAVILGILVFTIGEMSASPKFSEYVGRIAHEDMKALYMGSSFLSIALGHFMAGWISGKPYEVIADKIFLLKKAVAEKGFEIPQISDSFTETQYIEKAQELFGMDNGQLTRFLWDTYNPTNVWMIFSGLAITAAILMFLYDRFIIKEKVKSS